MRIEVGYGLEGILPDGLAGQVIRDQFTPRFRNGDYSGGIRDGVTRLVEIVEREHVLTPAELAQFNEHDSDAPPLWILIPFFGLFVTIGAGMAGLGVRTKTGFPLIFGAMFGTLPLLMSAVFMPRTAVVTLVPWAAVMFIVGYRSGERPGFGDMFRKGRGSQGSGWVMGTSNRSRSGSSSSGSSSSSSGFGGGSSGGGGASGSW
jgi:uncharacterized protein